MKIVPENNGDFTKRQKFSKNYINLKSLSFFCMRSHVSSFESGLRMVLFVCVRVVNVAIQIKNVRNNPSGNEIVLSILIKLNTINFIVKLCFNVKY